MKKKIIALMLILLLNFTISTAVYSGNDKTRNYEAYDFGPEIRAKNIPIDFTSLPDTVGLGHHSYYAVGDTIVWLTLDDYTGFYDFDPYQLRAIGTNAEIWVQVDMSWPDGDPREYPTVTQEQIDYLLSEYDTNIYSTLTTYYGTPNFHDGSNSLLELWGYVPLDYYDETTGRTAILVSNIKDENYYDPETTVYIGGFFSPTLETYFDRNVITIDTWDWENRIGPEGDRPYNYEGTIAHELEHLIHYDIDPDEALWVDEGLADMAGYLSGYGHPASHLAYYFVYHRTPLTEWNGGLEDYGASYLLQLYLMENFGGSSFTTALVNDASNGIKGIENQLSAGGYSASFDEVFHDWTIANYLDLTGETGVSGADLGYTDLDIPSEDTWGYSIQWGVKSTYG